MGEISPTISLTLMEASKATKVPEARSRTLWTQWKRCDLTNKSHIKTMFASAQRLIQTRLRE